jgi:DNA-binding HxlR family transcriptional regulator
MTSANQKMLAQASSVPVDIRRATEALAGDERFAIVVALVENDGLSFAELEGVLDIHQQTLSTALDAMQDGAIVARKEIVRPECQYRTQYEVTEFGRRVIDSLYDAIQPDSTTSPIDSVRRWPSDTNDPNQFYQVTIRRTSPPSKVVLSDKDETPNSWSTTDVELAQ